MISREFQTAIALNNHGVAMLERHQLQQAMSTFKDAALILKMVSSRHGPRDSSIDVDSIFRTATQRLANPQYKSHGSIGFETISSTEQLLPTIYGICYNGPQPRIARPIRFEEHDIECMSDEDCDVESAVVLYNLSICHLCMSEICRGSRQKLLAGARKLLSVVHLLLASRLEEQDYDDERMMLTTNVDFLVLCLLTQLLAETNDGERNKRYKELMDLQRLIHSLYALAEESLVYTAAAA